MKTLLLIMLCPVFISAAPRSEDIHIAPQGADLLKEVLSKWTKQLERQLKHSPKDSILIELREKCLEKYEVAICPGYHLTIGQLAPHIRPTYETIVEIRRQINESTL